MRERRPHFKYAGNHPESCQCKACRIWRRRHAAVRRLRQLERVERRAEVTTIEATNEERSRTVRERVELVIQDILITEGWPQSVRRKAEDMFAEEAVRVCERHNRELQKIWAGTSFRERRRGAISSLQVLLGNHAPFRKPNGRLQDAKGNAPWVLDIWELTLDEWEGQRQLRLV